MTRTNVPVEFLDRLRTFVRRRVRSDEDAEDIVQDVLYRLIRRGEDDIKGSVHAWLFSVARNAIIDRHRSRRPTAPLGDAPEPAVTQPSDSTRSELARCLEPMLDSIAEDDRSLLIRVDRNGESQSDVARELHLPASTVKSRVQRARARLRKKLEDCCSIELDARGHPVEYEPRPGRSCPCEGDPD